MTVTLETKRVPGVPDDEGAFSARVYVVEGPPDADGDVILRGAIEDGARVVVSAVGHDVLAEGAEPAGEARLYHGGNAVVAIGRAFASERGRLLRQKVREPGVEWSVGYQVLDARPPTREERERHPATRRIIVKWRVDEISPVTAGSCGPACATLVSKAATCGGPCCADEPREAALKELIRFEYLRWQRSEFDRKQRERDAEERANATRPVVDDNRAILEGHELRPWQVNSETRRAAEEAVERAAKILGGAAPPIRWYGEQAVAEVAAAGMHFKGDPAVWIGVSATAEEVYSVACHEVYHCVKDSADEGAAEAFATKLSLLRGVEISVGARKNFEGRLEWVKSECFVPYLAAPSPRLQLVPGLRAGALVADGGALYERTEDDAWHRVAVLVA